jgi:2-hydroxy-6-oxonona-2,4-dienedioate hydrolase
MSLGYPVGRFVQTPTFRIHYHEAGSGRPLLLLHGSGPGTTGWSNFYPNIPVLAESFHVYAIDMPHHPPAGSPFASRAPR